MIFPRRFPRNTPFILASGVPFHVPRPRFAMPAIAVVAGLTLFAGRNAEAANTQYNVKNGSTDLTAPATYTTGGTSGTGAGGTAATTGPTVTSDVLFNSGVAYAPAAFTLATNQTFGSLDDLSTTAVTISNTGGAAASTLTLGGAGDLGDGVVGSNAADLLFVGTGANLTLTGGTGATALNLALGQSGNFDVVGTAAISSVISDGGANFGFTKTGAGTLTLSGVNTYGGLTQINAGQITLTGATTKFGNGGVTIQAGTLLDSSTNVTALGTGTLTLGTASTGASAATFNFNANSGTPNLANAINVAAGPTGALTIETTSGALTLSGLITLNNNLNVVNTNSNGSSLNLTGGVAGTGNLVFAASSAGGFILGPTGTVNFTGTISNVSTGGAGFGISANLTGAESLLQNSATSTTTVSGTNTNTGTTTVTRGVLDFAKEVSLYNGTTGTPTATAANLIVQAGATAGFQVGGTGTFTATDLATLNALGTATGGFEDGSRFGVDTAPGNFTYANAITNNNGGANSIGLTKLGANTLTLIATNTYTGLTTISTGTLQIGAGGTVGTLGSGTVTDNGTLTFNRTDNYGGPITNTIGGSGALSETGVGGTLTLSAANTFTGATTVTSGTLDLANSLALQNSTLTAPTTGTLIFDAGVTSNAFTVGALTGANNVALQNNAATPAGITLTVGSEGNNTATTTYSGILSGPGGLTKASTIGSTLVLTGANTYTGATTLAGGTINLGGATGTGSISSSSTLVLGGGTLAYTNTAAGATQTFNGTTIQPGASFITESLTGQTINLGAITHPTVGGEVDFGSTGTINTTTTTNLNGILGGYATFGGKTTWAVAPATTGGAITGLTAYTPTATVGTTPAGYAAQNVDVTASETLTGGINPNSLRFNSATAQTLTLTGVNSITSGGILVTPTVTVGQTITGGTLVGSAAGDLAITSGDNNAGANGATALTIGSLVVDNGTAPTTVSMAGNNVRINLSLSNANNSFSGGLLVNEGLVTAGTGTGTPLGTGNITISSDAYTGSGGSLALNGSNAIATGLLVAPNGVAGSNGSLANSGGTYVLSLVGSGTATFNGTFGSYAGGRVVNPVLDSGTQIFGNTSLGSSLLTVNGGTMQLGNGYLGTFGNGAQNVGLAVGGGTFNLYGPLAGNVTQAFNSGLAVNSGASTISVTNNSGAGALLTLNAITRSTGGTVNFIQPSGSPSLVNGTTTTTLNTNGIVGGYATVGGTDWATNATNTAGGNVIGLSASTINAYSTDTYGTGLNTDVTTSATGANTNSLRFNSAGANTVTFNGLSVLTSGGILVTPNVGANATTITGGALIGTAQDLVVIQNNPGATGALTISSAIGANGATSGLTKSGPGTLILAPDPNGAGPNYFTGALTINGGIVNLNQDGLGTASSIVLNGGVFQANGAINGQTEAATPANIGVVMGINGGRISTIGGNVTLPGNVTNAAGSPFVGAGAFGGFNSTGVGALTVGGGGTLTLSGTGNNFGGGLVIANGTVVDAAASGASTLGTGYVTFGAANTPTVDLSGHSATVAGLIGTGTNGLVTNNATAAGVSTLTLNGVSNQSFAGTIRDGTVGTTAITLALNNPLAAQILTGANTYSGGTLVNVGTLLVNNATGSGTGSGTVTIGNGTTLNGRLGGTGTIGGATTVNAGSAVTGGTFGTVGMLTMTSTLNLNGTYAADLGAAGASDRLVLSATGANGILAFGTTASIAFTGTPDVVTYILATYASDTGFASLLANSTVPTGYSLIDTGTMLELTSVPEPSTWATGVLGALALLGTSLFKRRGRGGSLGGRSTARP